MAFLREQGAAFSDIHPQLARYLQDRHVDPDIERLLEGFAFLTGKLREKIDDEFPEFTHSMISMLWPNYLRPIPSSTIVKFTPNDKAISARQVIPAGALLDSHAVQDTVCRFRTCRPVELFPIRITDVAVEHSRAATIIDLEFANDSDFSLQEIALDRIRFYLGGQPYSAQMLYLWLSHYLDSVEILDGETAYRLPPNCFASVGFEPGSGVLPYPKNAYEGYRILQEYMSTPEVFHFFDITGVCERAPKTMIGNFTLRLRFGRTLPADVMVGLNMFQLYCTPAINLFGQDADPVDLNGKRTEYPLLPSSRSQSDIEIFSVDRVQGWVESPSGRIRGTDRIYSPFESFQHEVERARHRTALYYRLKTRESLRNAGLDHFISFVRGDETLCTGLNESVSIRLTCSNRQVPAQLGKGDICIPTESSPNFADFTNISQPSTPLQPVLDGSLLWTLISNLSLNYLSLLSKEAISAIIKAYDFKALSDRQAERVTRKRLEGIVGMDSAPCERIIRGLPVRGLRTHLELDQGCFASEGDLYLFATTLSHFFALYTSINSFHELVVVNTHNKERYTWDIQVGQQPLI